MRRRAVAVLALLACGGASFGAQHTADNGPIDPGFDYHSYANIDQFRATHLELEMRVDFEAKTITGVAGFEFKRLDPRATQLVLDTKGLMINDVRQKASNVLEQRLKTKPSGSAGRFISRNRIPFSAARWSSNCRRRESPSSPSVSITKRCPPPRPCSG